MSVPLKFFQTNLMHFFSAALNLAQLILGLDLYVILIQEPYAKSTRFSPSVELQSIPPGYSTFHSLSEDHAFGAAIIARTSLNSSLCSYGLSNSSCGILLAKDISFFSVYCRPSLPSISVHLESFLDCIPSSLKKGATFAIDCNSKSPA